MASSPDIKVTIKVTVPYASFKKAQEVSQQMVDACREAANHPGKKAKVLFVKVEE